MRFPRLWSCLLGASMAAALSAAAGPARAQLALDRFEPAPAGDRFFGVPSPYAAGDLTPHVMALLDYAHNPLVLKTVPANTSVGSVVKNQLYLNLDGGLSLWNRLFLDVDVPIALAQSGDSPTGVSASGVMTSFKSPSSAQFGDVRLGARVRIWGEYWDPFQIAVGGYVWLPTGAKDSFVSTGQVRGLPQLILGGRAAERVVWTAALGPEIQGASTFAGVGQGTMFRWGAGVGVLLLQNRHLQIGPEIYGDIVPRDLQKRTTNAELLVDVRYRVIDDLELALGAGPGLTSGIGTPDFRGIFSIAYTPEQKRDRDHDGIADVDDACPDDARPAEPRPGEERLPAAGPRRRRHPRRRGRVPRREGRGRRGSEEERLPAGSRRRRHPRRRGRLPRREGRARPGSEEERLPAGPRRRRHPRRGGRLPRREGRARSGSEEERLPAGPRRRRHPGRGGRVPRREGRARSRIRRRTAARRTATATASPTRRTRAPT